jgi:uncharacterized protein YndB with AHSA1/START domain
MIRVQHRLLINEPMETVFHALANFEAEPRWQPAVLETRLDPVGPIHIGTKTIQKRKFGGRTITTIGEIVEYEPSRKIVSRSTPDNPPPAFETMYEVEPAEQGTQVTYSIVLTGKGIFNLIAPLIQRSLTKDVASRFVTLKTKLETNHHL